MVSCIGPKVTLTNHGISVVADVPGVGPNLQKQTSFGPSFRANVLTASALGNATYAAQSIAAFIANQTGLAGSSGGTVAGWEKLPSPQRDALSPAARIAPADFPADWPELEYLQQNAYAGNYSNPRRDAPRDGGDYAASSPASRRRWRRASATSVSGASRRPTRKPRSRPRCARRCPPGRRGRTSCTCMPGARRDRSTAPARSDAGARSRASWRCGGPRGGWRLWGRHGSGSGGRRRRRRRRRRRAWEGGWRLSAVR